MSEQDNGWSHKPAEFYDVLQLERSLHDKQALHDGMHLNTAAGTVWALIGPELHELFLRDRTWSPGRDEAWLSGTLRSVLLADPR